MHKELINFLNELGYINIKENNGIIHLSHTKTSDEKHKFIFYELRNNPPYIIKRMIKF